MILYPPFNPPGSSSNILFSTHQDPGVWEGGLVARAARDALLTKYSLLPLLYTLFFVHSTVGETVVRPLWHEFPQDSKTRDIDTQVRSWSCLVPFFLLSSFGEVPSLSPQSWSRVLRNGRTTLKKRNILNVAIIRLAYLPDSETWYDFYTGQKVTGGEVRNF